MLLKKLSDEKKKELLKKKVELISKIEIKNIYYWFICKSCLIKEQKDIIKQDW